MNLNVFQDKLAFDFTVNRNKVNQIQENKHKNYADYSSNIIVRLFHILKKNNCLNLNENSLESIVSFSDYMQKFLVQEENTDVVFNEFNKKWSINIMNKIGLINFTYNNKEEIEDYHKSLGLNDNKNEINKSTKKEVKKAKGTGKSESLLLNNQSKNNNLDEISEKKLKQKKQKKEKKEKKIDNKDKDYNKNLDDKKDVNEMIIDKTDKTDNTDFSKTDKLEKPDKQEKQVTKVKQNKKEKQITQLPKFENNYHYFEEIVPISDTEIKNLKKKYTITLELASGSQEKQELYNKYMKIVHNKESNSFDNFICSNPFIPTKEFNSNNPIHPKQYGAHHMVHRIDGKIFAIGVLDILPCSIVSVYCYYDPDYRFLYPGIVAAIREIEFTKELRKNLCSSFTYYNMCYYLNNNKKMRYKKDYYPIEILCPITYNYVDFEKVFPIVDKNIYAKLSDDPKRKFEMTEEERFLFLENLKIAYYNDEYFYNDFLLFFSDDPMFEIKISVSLSEFISSMGKVMEKIKLIYE